MPDRFASRRHSHKIRSGKEVGAIVFPVVDSMNVSWAPDFLLISIDVSYRNVSIKGRLMDF